MPKTRFLVMQDSVEREVLTVEERASGDLTLTLPMYPFMRFNGQRNLGSPKYRKVSVHLSPNSHAPLRTIKHEMGFNKRQPHRGYAVITYTKEKPFLWPVFVSALGKNLRPFDFKPRYKRDVVRGLCAYQTAREAMFLSCVVTNVDLALPEARGLSQVSQAFRKLRVSLLYNFADIPSALSGFDSFPYTLNVQGDGIPILGETKHPRESMPMGDLEDFLLNVAVQVSLRVQSRTSTPMFVLPPKIPQFKRFPEKFVTGPSLKEILYGENSLRALRHGPKDRISPNFSG